MTQSSSAELAWTSWPARERPAVAAIGLVAVIAFGAFGGLAAGHWIAGIGCSLALLFALQRFYAPVRCTVGSREATVRTLLGSRSLSLALVRRVLHDGRVILLSTRSRSGSLDALRGLVLPLPEGRAESIVPLVMGRVERARDDDSQRSGQA